MQRNEEGCTQDYVAYTFHYMVKRENMVLFMCSDTYNLHIPKWTRKHLQFQGSTFQYQFVSDGAPTVCL